MANLQEVKTNRGLLDLPHDVRQGILKKAQDETFTWKNRFISFGGIFVILMVYNVIRHYVHLLDSWINYLVAGIIFIIYLCFRDRYYQKNLRKKINELIQADYGNFSHEPD